MNTYYLYDEETKEFDGVIIAEEQPANGTLIPIPLGLYMPIKFDETAQKWTGLTKEEWEQANPSKDYKPSALQEIIMQQAMTIAQMQNVMMQQNKDIAKLKGVNA